LKITFTVAEKDGQIGRLMIGNHQIRISVAIHIRNGDVVGKVADRNG
jgi:hypothetical protein